MNFYCYPLWRVPLRHFCCWFGVCLLFAIEQDIIGTFTHSNENCPNDLTIEVKSFSIWLTLPYSNFPLWHQSLILNIPKIIVTSSRRFHCVFELRFLSYNVNENFGCSLKLHCIGNSVVEQIVKIMSVKKTTLNVLVRHFCLFLFKHLNAGKAENVKSLNFISFSFSNTQLSFTENFSFSKCKFIQSHGIMHQPHNKTQVTRQIRYYF